MEKDNNEEKYIKPILYKVYTKEEKEARNELIQQMKKNVTAAEVVSNLLGLNLVATKKNQRYLKCKELSSLVVDQQKNVIFWNKMGSRPMDIFSFIQAYENCSMTQAIELGLEYYLKRDPQIAEVFHYDLEKNESYTTIGLTLPEPNESDEIATDYLLNTRKISEFVIDRLKKNNMFYEDTHHNCVFVGYDFDGKPMFGVKRGTIPSVKFQRDCLGSNKNCGFFIENKYPVKKLVLTECVIDGLSYLSLNKDIIDSHVLCSSGAGCMANTLWYNLNTRDCLNDIEEVIFAGDNDGAGHNAYNQVKKYIEERRPHIKLTLFNSFDGEIMNTNEDLNDLLKKVKEKEDSIEIAKEPIINHKSSIEQDEEIEQGN